MPDDKQWMIGFCVALGELPPTKPLPKAKPQVYQLNVKQEVPPDLQRGPDPSKPYFHKPRVFVKISKGARGPLFDQHNHFVSITTCPNGDLLAAWFTCMDEMGRELGVAISRLRHGMEEWEAASSFWDAPDRNDHTHAIWNDGRGTLYHFNGLGANLRSLAMVMRTSTDNGVTWSEARLIYPDHDQRANKVVTTVFQAQGGEIILPQDGGGGSVISISRDEGQTWSDPGGSIRGTHGGVTQLADGRLLAFGRHGAIEGMMPQSVSSDLGKTWTYTPSVFQPIGSGRRLVLLRLHTGEIFFASYCRNMLITDASGQQRPVSGLFGALSPDEGRTWPYRRLISDDGPGRDIETMDGHPVTLDARSAEPVGYSSVCQSPDGVIHLVSSREHYSFNTAWLKQPPPAAAASPSQAAARDLPERKKLAIVCDGKIAPGNIDPWAWKLQGAASDDPDQPATSAKFTEQALSFNTAPGKQFWWRSENVVAASDQRKGFTAEIRARILTTTPANRGVDLELYDGAGSRYAITITESGVYWYEGATLGSAFLGFDGFTPLAQGLNNSDGMHSYCLAVRGDRVAQIYRDGKLLATKRYEYRTPRLGYLQWGAGSGVRAEIEHIASDLSGDYQP